ncbi:hypothetical protein HY948_03500 [Candidatus Gottesmanbacteria bacterium]|nr:hypothetical protein [Candidatus Gottesmanbacteria bacterium]
MKAVWLSANKLGLALLKEAIKTASFELTAIITLREGAKTVTYDGVPTKQWRAFGVQVFEIEELNREVYLIKKLAPELIIMCGWRQILNDEILRLPEKGVIGFHPTLLPFGRGPAPIINSILKGVRESGLTMFYVDAGLDDGDIIAREEFEIGEDDHAGDVYNKVIKAGKKIVNRYLPLIIAGKAPRTAQDATKAVIFEKPKLENNRIELEKESIDEIYTKIKALSRPYKGAYIERNGKKLIFWKAELREGE